VIVGVDCEADCFGDPRPVRLHLGARALELVRVLDVWPGADDTYVKVEDAAGTTWILHHDRLHDQWEVTMYGAFAGDHAAGPARSDV
jgi:hypothetical protein